MSSECFLEEKPSVRLEPPEPPSPRQPPARCSHQLGSSPRPESSHPAAGTGAQPLSGKRKRQQGGTRTEAGESPLAASTRGCPLSTARPTPPRHLGHPSARCIGGRGGWVSAGSPPMSWGPELRLHCGMRWVGSAQGAAEAGFWGALTGSRGSRALQPLSAQAGASPCRG